MSSSPLRCVQPSILVAYLLIPRRQVEPVADLLHSAAIHLLRRAREHDDEAPISASRLSALSVVAFRGPLTVGELATAEGVRSPTMTGLVNGLERDRLVRRRPGAHDGRAVLVEATSSGRRLLDRARARRIELVGSRLEDLSAADLELLRRAGELLESRFGLRP
ncbi:MAG: MarR family transcriptional regulator [Acidimicrobiaceae bacterium]|nr:MarR family transcriptional regulator [Acidimicrobiaceae bacterium]